MEKILKTDKESHLLLGYVSSVRFERYSQCLFQALDQFTAQKYFLQKRLVFRAGNGSLRVTHDPSDPLSS